MLGRPLLSYRAAFVSCALVLLVLGLTPVGPSSGATRLRPRDDVRTSKRPAFAGNCGTGSFGPFATATVGNNPESVAAGDFDHDGDLDLASANANPAMPSV